MPLQITHNMNPDNDPLREVLAERTGILPQDMAFVAIAADVQQERTAPVIYMFANTADAGQVGDLVEIALWNLKAGLGRMYS